MGKLIAGLVSVLVALLVYVNADKGRQDHPPPPSARHAGGTGHGAVVRGRAHVVDADTLDVAGVRIRLHGIDAPERDQSCTRSGQAWRCGREASAALSGLVGGHALRCEPRDRDRYERVVAVCWMGDVEVNRWLVDQGWALAYRRYSTAYVSAEDAARQARRGIWTGSFETPEDYRRTQPERRRF
jgi:endonuclease YncB( thermonuclease family)